MTVPEADAADVQELARGFCTLSRAVVPVAWLDLRRSLLLLLLNGLKLLLLLLLLRLDVKLGEPNLLRLLLEP